MINAVTVAKDDLKHRPLLLRLYDEHASRMFSDTAVKYCTPFITLQTDLINSIKLYYFYMSFILLADIETLKI